MAKKEAVFTPEQLAQIPDLTAAEARRLLAEQTGGEGIVEDEGRPERDPVGALLDRQREAKWDAAINDAGNAFRAQAEEMKSYFATCPRHAFTHHEDRPLRVEINGYVFRIPPHRPFMLPVEVIEIIENKARVEQQHRLLSAVFQARANKPLSQVPDTSTLAGVG